MGENKLGWIRNRYTTILTAVLVVEATLFYAASRGERVPDGRPLASFPTEIAGWHLVRDFPIEQEIQDQLKADDIMNRVYTDPTSQAGVNLFVAYFKTQRTGQSPHSPKNCLPGSGWEPTSTGFMEVPIEGQPQPIRINRYVVSHGDEKSVVLYWYQSQRRVIASEFAAKFWLVMDSIRYHRSDTALARVTVPVGNGGEARASAQGVAFVREMYPVLKSYLPE